MSIRRDEALADGDSCERIRRDVLQSVARIMFWVQERVLRTDLVSKFRTYASGIKSEKSERAEGRHGGRTRRGELSSMAR